jgi:phenylpropionate dioxygenase-like ring-hydroxylating dioxygenase large terminal subunit
MPGTTEARNDFDWQGNSPGGLRRVRKVVNGQAQELAVSGLRALPGIGKRFDRPRRVILRASGLRMYAWARAPYGSRGKPENLREIPRDYVNENKERIPFLGLREYWYPALRAKRLRHNQTELVTLCGENIVLFRDEHSRVRALAAECPHRKSLLSLGQVGVFRPGTITCRYHGVTLDGDGQCVAILSDGPDSPGVGKLRARSYPTDEAGGIIWIYMGERDPEPVLDSVPHARDFLLADSLTVFNSEFPFSFLSLTDNFLDMAHANVLHHSCVAFIHQKLWDNTRVEELECGGLHGYFEHSDPDKRNAKQGYAHEVHFDLPSSLIVPASAGTAEPIWVWGVPTAVDKHSVWGFIPCNGSRARRAIWGVYGAIQNAPFAVWPGSTRLCVLGGDAAMQGSQGAVPIWSTDRLMRQDRGVTRVRKMLMDAHKRELAERGSTDAARRKEREAQSGNGASGEAQARGNGASEPSPHDAQGSAAPGP